MDRLLQLGRTWGLEIALLSVLSAVLGYGLVLGMDLGTKWFLMIVLCYLAIATGLMFPDFRLFLILLLGSCIPVGFQYNILSHGNKTAFIEHYGGALAEPVINLVDIPIYLLAFFWCLDIFSNRKKLPPWQRVDTWMLGFLLFSMFSVYNTEEHAYLFWEVFRYFKYFLLYWILRTYLEKPIHIWGLIAISIFMLVIQAFVSVLQYFLFFQFPIPVGGVATADFEMVSNELIQRVTGILGHSNTFACYLCIICSFAVSVLFTRINVWLKLLAIPFLMSGCFALVLTFSRNGWMIFVFDVVMVCWFAVRKKRLFFAYVLAVILAGVATLGILVTTEVFHTIKTRIFDDDGKAFDSRLDLLRVAWEMVKAHPIFGIGLNSFEQTMASYDPTRIINVIHQPVHNAFALIAAETGVPALALVVVILGHFIGFSLRLLKKNTELSFAVGAIGMCTFLGGAIANNFDLTLRKESICGVVVMVGAMVMAMIQHGDAVEWP